MRYLVIPIAIILYLWWSYKSIKDIRKNGFLFFSKGYTVIWLLIMCSLCFCSLALLISQNADNIKNFFIKYW